MTEEKKLPTIEEWFEENKNENDCAGMTVGFSVLLGKNLDDFVNHELNKHFSGKIFLSCPFCISDCPDLNLNLDLVFSKDKDGRIVYFIDESKVELV